MAIYHLSVKIIGRGSGRSAIGSAAYRAGEKLRLVEKAAYRAGMELRDEDTQTTYDYTKKGGVVHKEIILPENAPPEYKDRETLWNAVEAREKRKDARLAREIEIALQTEFDLQENIELLREYIKENFVDKGMIVDFVIHNNEGNPHSHIMLTTRDVTPEGFGKKNRDWDKEENVLIWRENWARINNRKFEEKGLEERIDHRTLKAQGIDREPTIHLGHEAWALEKKGIATLKGDYNREIQRRNAEREAQKTAQEQEITAQTYDLNASKNNHGDTERKALMSAKRNMREIEEHLKAEKAEQIAEKMQQQRTAREETENFAKPMKELQEEYVIFDRELRSFQEARDNATPNA
jgi:ATP-dependent exoDNAse (exonuclease V) alpha subunit